MTTVKIDAYPPEQAAALIAAHVELNPGHILVTYACAGCGAPIGVICEGCAEPVCAIDAPDCGH